jgi:hypothetical protein
MPLRNQFSSEGELIGSFFSQSGWSIALRGKGEWTNDEVRSEFSESYFTLEKHITHKEGVSVQKSEEYKTLILMLLGEITFVIRPDCIFVNLWGACDSSVLQCRGVYIGRYSTQWWASYFHKVTELLYFRYYWKKLATFNPLLIFPSNGSVTVTSYWYFKCNESVTSYYKM